MLELSVLEALELPPGLEALGPLLPLLPPLLVGALELSAALLASLAVVAEPLGSPLCVLVLDWLEGVEEEFGGKAMGQVLTRGIRQRMRAKATKRVVQSNVEVRVLVLKAKNLVETAYESLHKASLAIEMSHGEELAVCVKALRTIANANDSDRRSRGLALAALRKLKLQVLSGN